MGEIPWWSSGWDSAFTAESSGSIPGWGTKILPQSKKEKKSTWNLKKYSSNPQDRK